jgi:serine/threonine protein kinase
MKAIDIVSTLESEQYTIIHKISKGGYGTVYAGIDKATNRQVAIKRLFP